MTQHMQLSDGRTLEYAILGGQGELPLIFLHGTPGAWTPAPGLEAACKQKGIPLITLCRAGYGDSSRKAGRKIVDAVKDVQALLDHLGYKKCLVGGWSGGGPHALACAARLPACAAAVAIGTIAPLDAEGLDWLAGQGEDNVEEFRMSQKGEQVLREYLKPQYDEMLKATAAETLEMLSSIFPEVDKKCMLEDEKITQFWETGLKQATKKGIEGIVDDNLAFIEPWGFDMTEIKRPVLVYHGDLDLMCPYAHGQWVADHIPAQHVTRYLKEGEGHLSIWLGKEGEMLDTLVSLANKTATP